MVNLEEKMQQWRDGLLSDGEILGFLHNAQFEVLESMNKKETALAEQNLAISPFGKR